MKRIPQFKQTGVTLLELVLVIIVVGVLTVPIASGFKTVGQGFGLNRELQMAAAFAQECAEHVLVQARTGNYAAIDNTACDVLPAYPGTPAFASLSAPVLSVTDVDNVTEAACPLGTTCKNVQITVNAGAETRATSNLLLVQY